MAKEKTIRLDGRNIPCEDVLKIEMKMVSDQLFSEFTYRLFEPCYHVIHTLVPRNKGNRLETTVRKYMQKR